jgi:hypothetical protein
MSQPVFVTSWPMMSGTRGRFQATPPTDVMIADHHVDPRPSLSSAFSRGLSPGRGEAFLSVHRTIAQDHIKCGVEGRVFEHEAGGKGGFREDFLATEQQLARHVATDK